MVTQNKTQHQKMVTRNNSQHVVLLLLLLFRGTIFWLIMFFGVTKHAPLTYQKIFLGGTIPLSTKKIILVQYNSITGKDKSQL